MRINVLRRLGAATALAAVMLVIACSADMSKYVSADGITIPGGDPHKLVDITLADEQGRLFCLLSGNPGDSRLFYSGIMECTRDGKLGPGTTKFKPTQLVTSKGPGTRLNISSFSIGKDGLLVVTDDRGASYRITLPVALTDHGLIEEVRTSVH
jgi:hypothetical protein